MNSLTDEILAEAGSVKGKKKKKKPHRRNKAEEGVDGDANVVRESSEEGTFEQKTE